MYDAAFELVMDCSKQHLSHMRPESYTALVCKLLLGRRAILRADLVTPSMSFYSAPHRVVLQQDSSAFDIVIKPSRSLLRSSRLSAVSTFPTFWRVGELLAKPPRISQA